MQPERSVPCQHLQLGPLRQLHCLPEWKQQHQQRRFAAVDLHLQQRLRHQRADRRPPRLHWYA